jgi:hypothetical protein
MPKPELPSKNAKKLNEAEKAVKLAKTDSQVLDAKATLRRLIEQYKKHYTVHGTRRNSFGSRASSYNSNSSSHSSSRSISRGGTRRKRRCRS